MLDESAVRQFRLEIIWWSCRNWGWETKKTEPKLRYSTSVHSMLRVGVRSVETPSSGVTNELPNLSVLAHRRDPSAWSQFRSVYNQEVSRRRNHDKKRTGHYTRTSIYSNIYLSIRYPRFYLSLSFLNHRAWLATKLNCATNTTQFVLRFLIL